jgi:SAM-dependent methyltransferase
MDLKELGLVNPETHWYYKHKSNMLKNLIGNYEISKNTIIEIGAGSGFFCKDFFSEFNFKSGYCVDPYYSPEQITIENGISFQKTVPKDSGDLYLFIDVLEHVDDPKALLEESVSLSNSNSIFLISVPAFQSLWSGHDVYLGHKKRFRLREIEDVSISAGLDILNSRYIFAPIYPIVLLKRKFFSSDKIMSDMQNTSPALSKTLELYLKLEKIFSKNRYFGTSALVLARKKN